MYTKKTCRKIGLLNSEKFGTCRLVNCGRNGWAVWHKGVQVAMRETYEEAKQSAAKITLYGRAQ